MFIYLFYYFVLYILIVSSIFNFFLNNLWGSLWTHAFRTCVVISTVNLVGLYKLQEIQ